MRILLTNDDGIDAPGLEALQAAAAEFGSVTTVAPLHVHSGCGHQVTTARPLRIIERGPDCFAVDGSPADSVRIAAAQIVPKPDVILAGINDGANLGIDIYMSGTVAAVREGAALGIPGIALSQYRRNREQNVWPDAVKAARRMLGELLELRIRPGEFWSVNFPDWACLEPGALPAERCEWTLCEPDRNALPIRFEPHADGFVYSGNYHDRPRCPGSDVDVCFRGRIAVSRLSIHCRHTTD